MSKGPLNLIHGDAAHELLKNQEFVRQWRMLHSTCTHATVFQEPEFAWPWYEAYRSEWQPVIVFSRSLHDELSGLLLLAYSSAGRDLVHVGHNQAEYHLWLALPGNDASFLSSAWEMLTRQFDFKLLRFRYLPVAEPLGSILAGVPNLRIGIRKRPRPLMTVDAEEVKASFAKKSNKSRFNRLKRLGEVSFRRITDKAELEKVFDDLIAFYDLRQGAVNNARPFQYDAIKRKFHIDLFDKAADKAHVTVTYLNDKPVAGLWGLVSGKTVHLGMIMHSPFLAEHSLGKLHIMQLSQLMISEGRDVLDLTPGSDPWKERFANAHDEVAEAIIYRSASAGMKGELSYGTLNWIRNRANRFGFTSAELKDAMVTVREAGPLALAEKMVRWARSDQEFSMYQLDRSSKRSAERSEKLHCNSLDDLLLFDHAHERQSGSSFLSAALYRLEQGESVYTQTENGKLVYCAWMAGGDVKQSFELPPDSVVIHDIYCRSDFGQEMYQSLLSHLVSDAFADEKIQHVILVVRSKNKEHRQRAEAMGFVEKGSIVSSTRFGKESTVKR